MSGDVIEMDGVVLREFRGDVFEVEARIGVMRRIVLARRCGKMNQHRIHVLVGDRVTVEVSPYDTHRGRITFRHKEGQR
jgi:translation initiation factor IF-1